MVRHALHCLTLYDDYDCYYDVNIIKKGASRSSAAAAAARRQEYYDE